MNEQQQALTLQALEALKLYQAAGFGNSTDFNKQHEAFYKAQVAITALRQALEQPATGCDYCNHPQYAGTKCKNCHSEKQPADNFFNQYNKLCDAMGYDSGKDGLAWSPEEWASHLVSNYNRGAPLAVCEQEAVKFVHRTLDKGAMLAVYHRYSNPAAYQDQIARLAAEDARKLCEILPQSLGK